MTAAPRQTVTIKKYANRRLYNTATSSYVTLEDLSKMVKEGTEFNVYDAKSSEDITRSVLTQIIVEEEGKAGQNLLPVSFLRQLIGFYGDNMQWLVPKYLEHSMQTLSKNQDQIRGYFQSTFGGMFPFGSTLEEMGKQNLAMFERAMRIFAPFGAAASEAQQNAASMAATLKDTAVAAGQKMTDAATSATAATASTMAAATSATVSAAATAVKAAPPMATVTPINAPAPGGEDVQNKIAALQRQLADLAKAK